ncbi:bifunctional ADP-dependent NAD(P)H-hydrate dehydratase/NAD(P)H-hydrate epimerase [Blattabacterium sp. (Blaberus giganteus)]|uniref:bifunctional ADP-dependent NAD(P)H-hydrate dehydratase/NAD(P)H-hydrate epimerase n=1 Tax=Blattabacterium sp. (Blaberus giganteus) TaxID=1186051 RepID=UPI00025F7036|nr:bifunctional ADP-dependent NAD(P)H-hydrate dehydratase/NAD(P)H-hydrate epimerase [Blattabacterium sp. (Blaberus giganteus)]AFJ90466.1 Putative kinase, ribokinase-like superfamily [Blattabacterium sp. (Blaberus giganteus)]
MKILSLNQIRKADQYCIDSESISSVQLMERAAKSCFNWMIHNKYFKIKEIPFIILVGNGNNGGDGLSLSYMLHLYGAMVSVYLVNISSHFSNEFLIKKNEILQHGINFKTIFENEKFPYFYKESYIIDAIFGIGFNRTINSYWKSFFRYINEKKFKAVISIDVPSGLFMEKNHENFEGIIKATHTLTFQVPKLPFLFPNYADYVGKWYLINIGWKEDFLRKIQTKNFYIDNAYIHAIYKKKRRQKFSHKGNYGHGMIIGGSFGMMGSVVLSATASFRTGIGKLNVYVPYYGYKIIQNALPEAIVNTDKTKQHWINNIVISNENNINAIGIGMGMGVHPKTVYALESFLLKIKNKKIPMVIDADAINILSHKLQLLDLLPEETILTPHPKEFQRLLCRSWKNDYDKLRLLKEMSKKYKIFIVFKGAHTIISTPSGNLYFNSTGNPGMSTAGSGDILTGMIMSLLSQGYSTKESCIMGVYLHGLAGDIASKKLSKEAIIANDIINHIGEAYLKIKI